MGDPRLRFAPSPTGLLHLGGARTALFNYLFARYHGGALVLRIEDTDWERSSKDFERGILSDLEWLGIPFDEGPHRQSERGDLYAATVERLREKDLVYEAEDESGRWATYFRPHERSGSFRDALRGEVSFSRIGDFVILKSDGSPSYNFAVVADDIEMKITHVIRGEEHLSNTARQTLLYRALGEAEPEFVHLGLILGPDGKKLSKRHGAVSVTEYRREGYLPEAIVNYLALLGWTHPEGREEFADLEELAREWDPSRLGVSPATFDPDRLLRMNFEKIQALPEEELHSQLEPFLRGVELTEGREEVLLEAIRQDLRVLSDAPRLVREVSGPVAPASFASDLPDSSDEVFAHTGEDLRGREIEELEQARVFVGELRAWAKEKGIKTRDLLHPLRLALMGRDRGPEMAYLFAVLGSEEARRRIEAAREARLDA
jgi:glutamyl-tRNA synthetase